jgi:deazaflavin-dependent oxidoreductase (nitroreductase family)
VNPRRAARLLNLSSRFPRLQAAATRYHARAYVESGGRRGGRWVAGLPVMVIETVGRRSGEKRASPIVYVRDGDGYLVTPANAGAAKTPAWWLNLQAAGEAAVVIRGERRKVRPRVLEGAERERAWRAMTDARVTLDDYDSFTDRELPMVRLEPVSAPAPGSASARPSRHAGRSRAAARSSSRSA